MFGLFKRGSTKKEVNQQSTFCYCPNCTNELIGSNSFVSEEELVTYKCTTCSTESKWLFGGAPAPLLIYVDGEEYKHIVHKPEE